MKKQIEIRIFPSGEIKGKTVNIKGKECLKYIEPIANMMEAKVVDSDFTSEYYQTVIGENQVEHVQTKLRR